MLLTTNDEQVGMSQSYILTVK